MGKSRAEIQADYRERKKKELGEESYRKAEAARQKKYYVPVARLSRRERKERQADVNSRVRKHRRVKKRIQKEVENQLELPGPSRPTCTDSDSAVSDMSSPGMSAEMGSSGLCVKFQFKKRASTRKRTSRALSRAHMTINDLETKLQKAKRENKKIQKRYERAAQSQKKSTSNGSTDNSPNASTSKVTTDTNETPRSRAASQLKNAGLTPRSSKAIKKHLIFANAVCDEVQIASKKNKKSNEKNTCARIISGRVLKKYRMIRYAGMKTGLERRKLTSAQGKNITQCLNKKQVRRSWRVLHEEVLDFLTRDDNSRMMPGKKDACKSGGTKKQVRTLNDYLENLYLKYKSEYANCWYVSFSSFQRIRRCNPHIKLVHFTARNTCLCQKHQNFALKLKALKGLGVVPDDNPDDFVKVNDADGVDRLMETLHDKPVSKINFEEWNRVTLDGYTKTKLTSKVIKKEEFVKRFKTESKEFSGHVERVKVQFEAIRKCKENLGENECLVQMDFAENYTCKPLDEVQSGYWNQTGVTLHPTVVYYREESILKHRSLVAVSDEKAHNAATIMTIIQELIPRIRSFLPAVHRIHYWTDSPTAQYRNKTIFSLTSAHHDEFDGVSATWNYFEAGHGKGPCDGVGGTVKRLADDAVKRHAAVIQDAHDFYAWASQEREESNITYFFVSKHNCAMTAKKIEQKWSTVETVKGTMKIHAVVGSGTVIGDPKLLVRNTSCYCENCWIHKEIRPTSSMCSGWESRTLTRSTKKTVNDKSVNNEETDSAYQANDWVSAVYDDDWYIGQVIETDDRDVHINFMVAGSGKVKENTFKWPLTEDKIWVGRDEVLCHINEPVQLSKRLLGISKQQAAMIIEKHAVFKAKRMSELML